jgi:hypothetical protein
MKTLPSIRLLISLLSIGFLGTALDAKIISVNIGGEGDNTKVDGAETFGVAALDTVTGGWNNIGWNFENLLWNDGSESTVGVTVAFPNERSFYGPGYINTPLNYGAPHYEGTNDDPGTGLSFYNLAANFPDGYYIIVYISGFKTNEGGLITNGRTTFYYRVPQDNQTPLTPEALIEATDTVDPGAGNYKEAHYAVFGSKDLPLISDFYSIRLDVIAGGAAALCGVQIVSTSEDEVASDWAGYPVDENGWANTEGWLGWVNVTNAPWIQILNIDNYGWIPEEGVTDSGAWVYVLNP